MFFGPFFGPVFLDHFFWTILKGGHTISTEGGGMKPISTEGGVGDRVLLPREGRETDYYYAGRGGRWLLS